ncbi:MAG TPA: heterodisulfide reductase-related iron-sulfur binding cluster [Candidatus Acidoferrales bacterium]|nr:heterodisulfide reductase-related iron-sulfur binding cluster [Candidatus Acidoferrales bacterium]
MGEARSALQEKPPAASNEPAAFDEQERPLYEDYAKCIHCGLCLNHCPTYRLWGLEADSPRGRIRQMLLVDQGQLELGPAYVTHIDRCLDCRACETACPSGVEYGKLVELARAQIEHNYRRPMLARLARRLAFRHLLPYPRRIAAAARAVRFYQRSRLQGLARHSGALRVLGLAQRERLLPEIDSEFFFSHLGQTFPAQGKRRARVAFFAGCVAQVTFSALHEATLRVLAANGCEVVVPAGQLCCGALAAHAGVRDVARQLARTNLGAFLREEFDAVITNAAGCGSTLKEYGQLFPAGEPAHEQVRAFSNKAKDVTEFLVELGIVAPLGRVPLRVTYQDSCHLLHGQKIREAPRKLIRAVPGVELVEMPLADHCCGSAGVYNVTETPTALELLAEKMKHARATRAQTIVTANPGCLLQLRAGVAIHGTGQEVLHVVDLLDRAMAGKRSA